MYGVYVRLFFNECWGIGMMLVGVEVGLCLNEY